MKKILALILCLAMASMLLVACGAPSDLTEEYLEDGTWKGTMKAEDAFENFELAEAGATVEDAKTDVDMTIKFDGKSAVLTMDEDDVKNLIKEVIADSSIVDLYIEGLEAQNIFKVECGYTVDGNEVDVEGDIFEYEDGKLTAESMNVTFEK